MSDPTAPAPPPPYGSPTLQIILAIISVVGTIATAYLAYLAKVSADKTQNEARITLASASTKNAATEASGGTGGKFCFFANDSWNYTMPVPATWSRADCGAFAARVNSKYGYQIGCTYERGFSLVASNQTPSPDCGWSDH